MEKNEKNSSKHILYQLNLFKVLIFNIQSYVTAIISLHDLYTLLRRKWIYTELENQIDLISKELSICFQFQREFCNNVTFFLYFLYTLISNPNSKIL